MTLKNWLNNGWLKPHVSSAKEINSLLAKVNRDIDQAKNSNIDLDWRLAIAYNACLGCATIALRASGYRITSGAGQHYHTIQSLKYTLKLKNDVVLALVGISKKRAIANYDEAGTISEAEMNEAILLAEELKAVLIKWLKSEHPDLLPQ